MSTRLPGKKEHPSEQKSFTDDMKVSFSEELKINGEAIKTGKETTPNQQAPRRILRRKE